MLEESSEVNETLLSRAEEQPREPGVIRSDLSKIVRQLSVSDLDHLWNTIVSSPSQAELLERNTEFLPDSGIGMAKGQALSRTISTEGRLIGTDQQGALDRGLAIVRPADGALLLRRILLYVPARAGFTERSFHDEPV